MSENTNILLETKNLSKYFTGKKGLLNRQPAQVKAVDHVSLTVNKGETLGLVGESGCGKSTTGRLVNHILVPDSGEVWFDGKDISKYTEKEMRPLRKDIQMIFQDPYGALNPRIKIQDQIGEPLLIHTNMSAG